MRNFLDDLRYKFSRWMQGRYGTDEMNNALFWTFFVFWIMSLITKKNIFYFIGLVFLGYCMYRTFSRDYLKRSNERLWFLKILDRVKRYPKRLKQRWDYRKTHKFFTCKQCGVMIRVPKGKGRVEITCPKCGYKFIDKT